MNDELITKEYMKKIEQIKLADSSRLRMREELLAYARFHTTPPVVPKPVLSPFTRFLMKPAPIALVMVFVVGTAAFLLEQHKGAELIAVNETVAPVSETNISSDQSVTESPTSPIVTTNQSESSPRISRDNPASPVTADESTPPDPLATSRTKMSQESADSADTAMTMLSESTWSIEDHTKDVTKRIDALRTLIKKYDTDIAVETKSEFKTKLDAAENLRVEADGKTEIDARANLDKASLLIGEVESSLSLLGEVVVEDGAITDITFN
jgi:cytoskeletal protein RodZ